MRVINKVTHYIWMRMKVIFFLTRYRINHTVLELKALSKNDVSLFGFFGFIGVIFWGLVSCLIPFVCVTDFAFSRQAGIVISVMGYSDARFGSKF